METLVALSVAMAGGALGWEYPFRSVQFADGGACRDNMPLGLGAVDERCDAALSRARRANAVAGALVGMGIGLALAGIARG